MPTNWSKKKSRIRRRGHRPLLPLTGIAPTTTPAATTQTGAVTPKQTPTVQPIAPKPQPTQTNINAQDKEKIGRLFGSINRTKHLKKEVSQTQANQRTEAYTDTQLEEAWFRFVNQIPEHPDLHFLFNKAPNRTDNTLCIQVNNSVVYNKLNELKGQIIKHLSDCINNDLINIEVKMIEGKKQPTTARDKARAMNESNGALLKMFTTWGLKLQ